MMTKCDLCHDHNAQADCTLCRTCWNITRRVLETIESDERDDPGKLVELHTKRYIDMAVKLSQGEWPYLEADPNTINWFRMTAKGRALVTRRLAAEKAARELNDLARSLTEIVKQYQL